MLFDKLREEIAELCSELFDGNPPTIEATVDAPVTADDPVECPEQRARIEQEIGDVLFVVANIARRWGVNPEEALRHSNRKFTRRFQFIEQELARQGRDLADVSLQEMESLYQAGKSRETGD